MVAFNRNFFANFRNNICLNTSGAAIYSWSDGATLDTAAGPNVLAGPKSTTTYTITGTTAEGCVDSTTFTLMVNQLPIVTYTSSVILFV